jgi:hypothetical protein
VVRSLSICLCRAATIAPFSISRIVDFVALDRDARSAIEPRSLRSARAFSWMSDRALNAFKLSQLTRSAQEVAQEIPQEIALVVAAMP